MFKKLVFTVFILVFAATGISAQLVEPQHEDRIKKLEQELVQLQENLFRTDSLYYTRAYNNGMEGLFVFDKLYGEAEQFYSSVAQSSFLLKLMNVNNPSSLELRKRIMGDLQQMIESKIADITGSDTARKRNFFSVLRNIFSNPLIQGVASIVPIGTPVMNILSAISSVVSPRLKVEKNAIGGVKNVTLDIESMLNESPLKDIGNKIMPYLSFYDTLYAMNNDYNREIEYSRNQAIEIRKFVYQQEEQLKLLTGWKAGQPLNLTIGLFNALYISPAELRTKGNDLAAQRLKADSLNETAAMVIHEYNRLKNLKASAATNFYNFKTKYLAVLKIYAGKSALFQQYLEPIITQITDADKINPEVSGANFNIKYNFPAASEFQLPLIEKLFFKYLSKDEGSNDKMKKIIF